MEKNKIRQLFSEMCCSRCKSDFTDESIKIIRAEKDLYVIQVVCQNCKKSFGLAFLGLNSIDLKNNYSTEDLALQLQTGPDPISYDDVLDAHNFIQNLEHDWQKHIPSKYKAMN